MTNPITQIEGLYKPVEKNKYTDSSEKTMGQEHFLTMLMAQLKYQDPLNPMEGTEFSAQLAQFSSLEQLVKVNDNLDSMHEIQADNSRLQVLDLVGKEIETQGSNLYLNKGGSAAGSFHLESSSDCMIFVMDANGTMIKQMDLGRQNVGLQSFTWDGRDQNGTLVESGTYSFTVTAIDDSGEAQSVLTNTKGIVDKVTISDDEPIIYIGDTAISMSDILSIGLPPVINTKIE